MLSIEKLQKEIQVLATDLPKTEGKISCLERDIAVERRIRDDLIREHYEKTIRLCRIQEIYNLAKAQFSRLEERRQPILSDSDILELEKWIGRAKSDDGIQDILAALMELDKYKPENIKSNLYALVQKIIIGGAYKRKK